MTYSLLVRDYHLNGRFKIDYPDVTFEISITLKADDLNLDEAHKRVKKLLWDKHFRAAIAGEVHHVEGRVK